MSLSLSGLITALATPFQANGALDPDGWQRLLHLQLEGGVHGVVVAGSTGEAAALSDDEYDQLLRSAVKAVAGRIPVLAGTGLSGTAKTIEQTRRAAANGATHALVVTPPYVRPTQAGLIAHYRAVADQGGLPVILYNVPGRTGCDMLPETVAELARHPNIVGIKEAVGDVGRVHLYRWGDGGAHFHVWFVPRPLGMVEARGAMLPLWEEVLPNVPDEELASAARRVAAAMTEEADPALRGT